MPRKPTGKQLHLKGKKVKEIALSADIVDEEVARLGEQRLHEMYSAGAKDLTDADRSDRELWLGNYSNRQ